MENSCTNGDKMSITENIKKIKETLPPGVMLVAASKMNSAAAVREAITAGVDACGENRVQEMLQKHSEGAYTGAPLHFIGHLQSNKVRQVVGLCDLIESVSSAELLTKINNRAGFLGIKQNILLEINIAGEASKSGLSPNQLPQILEISSKCDSISVRGLMCIPPISEKFGGNRSYFASMYDLFIDIGRKKYDNVSMDLLSMGMSGDYLDAAAEGANVVRVGSAIFGNRNY